MRFFVYLFIISFLAVSPSAKAEQLDPNFYIVNQGQSIQPWELSLSFGQVLPNDEGSAKTTKGSLVLRPSQKQTDGDAFKLTWKPKGVKNEWGTEDKNVLTATVINRMNHTDWSLFKDRAALLMDVKVNKAPKKLVELTMECNWNWKCRSTLPLKNALKSLPKGEWVNLPIPLSCFDNGSFDFSKVTTPFMLYTSGKMSLEIANMQLVISDQPIACS